MYHQQIRINLGKSLSTGFEPELVFHKLGWQRILVEGESRVGKSAIAKHLTVMVSKHKKVCVFSLKGEWERHITEYNPYYKAQKQKLTNYKILEDFCVKLSDFDNAADFVSLGFTDVGCGMLANLIIEGKDYHKDDPERFQEMLNKLPTKERDKDGYSFLDEYEKRFGVTLNTPVFPQIKQSIITWFGFIKQWFWHNGDTRPYYDFAKEWMSNDHLIVSTSNDKNKARALCGLVLRKLKSSHFQTKGFFVFEEGRVLFPEMSDGTPEQLLPSSVREIYDMLTMGSKEGIAIMVITQREDQLYKPGIEHFFTKIIVGKYLAYSRVHKEEYELAKYLKWDPNRGSTGYRTALIYYKTGRYCIFEPVISCCKS